MSIGCSVTFQSRLTLEVISLKNRQLAAHKTEDALALPRGLRQLSQIKHLPKSGTLNHPIGSLCLLPRVSHYFPPAIFYDYKIITLMPDRLISWIG